MATSRRRERELARRRFERRRQAELERRARTKRRNTVLGASVGTVAVIAVLVILGIVFFGGSGKKAVTTKPATTPTATPTTPAPAAPTKCAKIKPNPPAKGEPMIPDVKGKAPTKLVVKDIKVGHGKAAKSGSNLVVKYVGVACSTGTAFDASYTDPVNTTTKKHDFPFTLGKGSVIPGWDQGLVGIKAGGVRELVIPASLAYGAAGQGAIKGNEVLIFVVTAMKV